MGDDAFEGFMGGSILDTLGGGGTRSAKKAAKDARDLPEQTERMMNLLLPLLEARAHGGGVSPFVEGPAAPKLSITPQEQELQELTQGLGRTVGVKPIEEAFDIARGVARRPTDLGSIRAEVEPGLSPAIQNLIERERGGRLQLGEELTSQGAALGSPLVEGQRRLSEQTNRDIAELMTGTIMKERELRGAEQGRALGELRPLGVISPILGEHFASLQRDVPLQQFGAERAASGDRMTFIQQVLDLLMGGIGAGTQQAGIRSNAILGGEALQQQARQQRMDTLFQVASVAGGAGGGGGGGMGMCWIADAIYGEGSLEAGCARYWISTGWQGVVADITRAVYKLIGRPIAKLVKRSKVLRWCLKPLFDKAVVAGANALRGIYA